MKADKTQNSQAIHLVKKGFNIETLKTVTVTPGSVEIPDKVRRLRAHNAVYINPTAVKTESVPSKVLDGFALLESTGMGFPEDGRRADLSGQGFREVIPEDMSFFTGLVYMDASDNMFDFKSFEDLPRLRELRLVCNEIRHLDDINGYFKLQYLDMSYNKLTLESIQSLEALPVLRDLDISGNDISRLPPYMDRFQSLERLIAEHNNMSDNSIFFDLCRMPKLRELSLAYNMLSCVPAESCSLDCFRCVL
jgi:Leucine-rich repeat (LRR) protein